MGPEKGVGSWRRIETWQIFSKGGHLVVTNDYRQWGRLWVARLYLAVVVSKHQDWRILKSLRRQTWPMFSNRASLNWALKIARQWGRSWVTFLLDAGGGERALKGGTSFSYGFQHVLSLKNKWICFPSTMLCRKRFFSESLVVPFSLRCPEDFFDRSQGSWFFSRGFSPMQLWPIQPLPSTGSWRSNATLNACYTLVVSGQPILSLCASNSLDRILIFNFCFCASFFLCGCGH